MVIAKVVHYLTGVDPNLQLYVIANDRIVEWDEAQIGVPKPTDQEIIDAGNSAEFAAWYAEHGGDPVLTRRRIAREAIEGLRDTDHLIRAALFAIVDELNRHADKHNEILDAVDAAVSLADFKARVAAIGDYPQRTRAQLKAAAVDIINDGTSD